MPEDTFNARIAEARSRINQLPDEQRGPLMAILNETVQRHEEMKQNFARIHDALGEWQLMVKYLIFDREATIRERDELRRRLGNQGR
ncbi:MAG: hypothetical protein HY718_15515 [Planctomycetes bacterium]|nr:hypothetical protein [Planctomycetota bacterium]